MQQFIDYGEENNHIQTRKIVLGHSIPLWIEIFAWRGFLARHYSDKRIFACLLSLSGSLPLTIAIMPESKSRQKPKDYKEDTSDLIKCLRKEFPHLQHQEVQDKLRRADNNELCFPECWRVSLKSSYLIIIQSCQLEFSHSSSFVITSPALHSELLAKFKEEQEGDQS